MVTMVGTEADFLNLLGDLASLDYDAIAAYDSAISRIDSPQFKQQLQQFREDHQRHTVELGSIISQLGGAPPSGAGAKSMLTRQGRARRLDRRQGHSGRDEEQRGRHQHRL